MSCLLVTSGRAKGRTFKILPDREAVIGRVSECDVCIMDPAISRRHCVISAGQNGYLVKDLGSANGVVLNGVRMNEAQLRDGDKLLLGGVEIEFHQEERFEDADTKRLAAAGAASGATGSLRLPPRRPAGREETQAVAELAAEATNFAPAPVPGSGTAGPEAAGVHFELDLDDLPIVPDERPAAERAAADATTPLP